MQFVMAHWRLCITGLTLIPMGVVDILLTVIRCQIAQLVIKDKMLKKSNP
jgi:hypothetical protein